MLRLFIAVTLPEEALDGCARETRRVEAALGPLARGVRFPRPEGLHFTLKFLGWTPEETVDGLQAALVLAAAKATPFDLVLSGLEAFPSIRKPRVIFLGTTEGGAQLTSLAQEVERHVAPLGFPTEARSFTPHVTLVRVKDFKSAPKIGERVGQLEAVEVARTHVSHVSLMLSELSRGGSHYSALVRVPLG